MPSATNAAASATIPQGLAVALAHLGGDGEVPAAIGGGGENPSTVSVL